MTLSSCLLGSLRHVGVLDVIIEGLLVSWVLRLGVNGRLDELTSVACTVAVEHLGLGVLLGVALGLSVGLSGYAERCGLRSVNTPLHALDTEVSEVGLIVVICHCHSYFLLERSSPVYFALGLARKFCFW